jgi:hypothetical protein
VGDRLLADRRRHHPAGGGVAMLTSTSPRAGDGRITNDNGSSGSLKMDTAIFNLPAVIDQPHLPSTLRAALETAADLASNSRAASTRTAYAADVRIFSGWCREQSLCPMPASPGTVAAFLADQVKAGMKPSTLGRRWQR